MDTPRTLKVDFDLVMMHMIQRFLEDAVELPIFERVFQPYYLDFVPDGAAVSDEFFGEVNERLDWTSEAPSAEERSDGWIDGTEFRIWLREGFERERQRRVGN